MGQQYSLQWRSKPAAALQLSCGHRMCPPSRVQTVMLQRFSQSHQGELWCHACAKACMLVSHVASCSRMAGVHDLHLRLNAMWYKRLAWRMACMTCLVCAVYRCLPRVLCVHCVLTSRCTPCTSCGTPQVLLIHLTRTCHAPSPQAAISYAQEPTSHSPRPEYPDPAYKQSGTQATSRAPWDHARVPNSCPHQLLCQHRPTEAHSSPHSQAQARETGPAHAAAHIVSLMTPLSRPTYRRPPSTNTSAHFRNRWVLGHECMGVEMLGDGIACMVPKSVG